MIGAIVLCGLALSPALQMQSRSITDCNSLEKLIREVYVFKPGKLNEKQQAEKAKLMDRVWSAVKVDPKRMCACLRSALNDHYADPWFLVDGSALLVEVDPSEESKKTLIRHWSRADLGDLAPEVFVRKLGKLGVEGFDVSEAGDHWLSTPDASYYLPKHAMKVGAKSGAWFLFGTMDENQATPMLKKIGENPKHPGREIALELLTMQMTPEALKTLKEMDLSGVSEKGRQSISQLLTAPSLLPKKGPSARVTREKILKAFHAFLKGDAKPLFETKDMMKPEGELDWAQRVVGVLKDEDIPLLRQVRRKRMIDQSDEALYDYESYSIMLLSLVWKPELFK